MKKQVLNWAAAASITLVLGTAQAAEVENYPTRQVTIIVPFNPGGGTDTTTRLLARALSEKWGQSVVVENKAGAAGAIGANEVARAKPDGYTLLMGNIGTQAINPSLYKLPYNYETAFAPITEVVELPLILVVNPKSGITSVDGLISAAKKDELFFSSSGAGSSMQLAAELFQKDAKVKMAHVPFGGEGPAVTNVMGGQVNLSFATIMGSGQFVKQGALTALAVSSSKRYPSFPEVPTVAESGLDGFNSVSWVGLVAPAGTPKAIQDKIATDVKTLLSDPAFSKVLIDQGGLPVGSTPEQFTQKINEDYQLYNRIIKENKIEVQ